jgi:hypothetical protein
VSLKKSRETCVLKTSKLLSNVSTGCDHSTTLAGGYFLVREFERSFLKAQFPSRYNHPKKCEVRMAIILKLNKFKKQHK